jgi:hypothetical protein
MIRVREIDGHFIVDNDPEIEAEFRKSQAESDAAFKHFEDQAKKRWEEHCVITERKWQDALSPPPPPRCEPAPLDHHAAPAAPAHRATWTLTKPKRFQGYAEPLHLLLESAHRMDDPKPTAREVLQAFARQQPCQIAKVIEGESLDYFLANGKTKTANLRAIAAAITGMTGKSQD